MMAQKIQIRDLQTNPGILPFKLGNARIKIASHTFLHYIQIDPIRNQTFSLINIYKNFKQVINSSTPFHNTTLLNAYKHLEYEVNTLNEKFHSLFPERRFKRGLVNPMGSLIKYFTGNMDAEDAKEIHDSISELEYSQNKIIRKVNKQISLTTSLMAVTNETLSKITNNQKLIENKIESLRIGMHELAFNYAHYLEIHEVLNQIKLNLDSLLNFLSELENAISFAYLKTLHHSIVSPTELINIIKILDNYHSSSQVLYSVQEYLKYYQIVETNVIITNDKVIFSLDFPLVHPDNFDYYHLYAIPNQNQSIIIPPSSYLLLSNNYYQYQDDECKNIQPSFLCTRNHLIPLQNNFDCVTSLLSVGNHFQNCQQIPVQAKQQMIEQINEAHYIGVFPKKQKVQTVCNENDVAFLQGTYLFIVPPKCEIKTSSFNYMNEKNIILGHPITLEAIKEIDLPTLQVEKIKLEKVSLDKLHELQLQEASEEPLQEIRLESRQSRWLQWIMMLLIVLIFSYLIYRNRSIFFKMPCQKTTPAAQIAINETQVVPPSSSF